MKIKYSLLSVAVSGLLLAACSPEENSLPGIDLTTQQMNEGNGFTVSVDTETNYVTFNSLLPNSKTIYWEYGPKPEEEPTSVCRATLSVLLTRWALPSQANIMYA